MNRVYRLVWSHVLGAWVVARENARGRGKSSGCGLAAATLSLAIGVAQAGPVGGQVTAGTASITQAGATTTITQSTANLSLNWQSFNTSAGETVNFVQPSASSIAVNRIVDTNGTQFFGHLNANGQVYLINPNGILFGQGAQVNVGGLVASTLDLNDATLNSNSRSFAGSGTGSIINRGNITAADGGYVALLGNSVSNQGNISARLGAVALAGGSAATLSFNGDRLVGVQVDQSTLNNLAENRQLISADGGQVIMTAGAKNVLLASAVNNSGVIEARTVENQNGTIVLLGGMAAGQVNVDGKLDASAPNGGNGGFIETSAAHVKVADSARVTTLAANGTAGTWLIDPVDFTIAASGGDITGTAMSTFLGASNVLVTSSAGATGTAGDINVNDAITWSANKLTLNAQNNININANLNGSGTASLALEYGQGAVAAGNTSNYTLSGGAKVSLPAGANFSTKLGSDGGTTAWTVITSLGVEGDATVAPVTMTLQGMNTGLAGNYVLGADIDASGTATWNSNAGFTAVGSSAAKFTGNFDGLGHTITGLTINRTANVLSNYYQGLFGWDTGALRNVGLLNSNIAGVSVVGALAGRSDGAVSYSYADGGSVTSSMHQAGGLVGGLGGSISNSYASVSVTGTSSVGASSSGIGGLVGVAFTGSSISNSYSTGAVNGADYVGGLVGQNRANIDKSYASGAVATGGALHGGFIGDQLGGTISNSYWDSITTGLGSIGGNSFGGGPGGTITSLTDVSAAPYAQSSYPGLDFAGSWRIYEGDTRPLLKSFLTPLTATATSGTRTYDATTNGLGITYSTAPNSNLLGTPATASTSKNAGTWTVSASGLYSNQQGYDISYVDGTLTINPAALTVANVSAMSKVYDGTTTAVLSDASRSLNGVLAGDSVQLQGTGVGTFADKNVANGKTVTVSGYSLGGTDAGNYTVSQPAGMTADITPKPLAVSGITTANKVYDGTTAATVTTAGAVLAGLVGGDAVTVNANGSFADKNVGTGKTVSLASSYGGADAGNYAITDQASTTANITTKALSVSGITAANKTYDGTTAATVSTAGVVLAGLVGGDAVTVSATGNFADKNVGTGKTVTLNSSYVGADAGNYSITGQASAAASITPASLMYAATPATFTAGQSPAPLTGTVSGLVGGDTLAAATSGGSPLWSTSATAASSAGRYAITGTGLTAGNYVFLQAPGNATALTLKTADMPATVVHALAAVQTAARKQADDTNKPPPVSSSLVVAITPGDARCEPSGSAAQDAGARNRLDLFPVLRGSAVPMQVIGCGVRMPVAQASAN